MRWKKSRRFIAIALALIVAQSTVMTTAISSYAYTTDKVESNQYGYLEPGETVSGELTDTISYTLDSGGTLTITGTGEIPDYMGSYDLPWYEYSYYIINVYVSEGITKIGDNTFNGLGRMSYSSANVSLPSTLKSLGSRAFASADINSLNLPSTLDSIGDYCFEGAYINSTITLEQVNSIGYMAFNGYIYSIFMPCAFDFSLFTNAGMEIVDQGMGKELRCGYNSTRLELIHQGTILSGKLTDTINYTLDCEGYLSITGKGEMPDYSSCSQTPWGSYAWDSYVGKDFIKYISIGEGITRIGNNTFNGVSDLRNMYDPIYGTSNSQQTYINVSMPSTLKSIGSCALSNNYLTSMWLPNKLEEIGSQCFAYSVFGSSGIMGSAGGMLSITSNVRIGGSAFLGCTLSYLELPCTFDFSLFTNAGMEVVDQGMGKELRCGYGSIRLELIHQGTILSGKLTDTINYTLDCDGYLSITGKGEIPDYSSCSQTPWGSYAWGSYVGKDFIKYISIGEGITRIGNNTFNGVSDLRNMYDPIYGTSNSQQTYISVNMPSTLKSIGDYAFANDYLMSISLPNKLEEIGSECFSYSNFGSKSMSGLGGGINNGMLGITSNVRIGTNAFYGCTLFCLELPCTMTNADFMGSGIEIYGGDYYCKYFMISGNMSTNNGGYVHCDHKNGYGKDLVLSGSLTSTIDYTLTCDGTLTITGTGEMPDFCSMYGYPYPSYMMGTSNISSAPWGISSAPWGMYTSEIKSVVIGEGITKIGEYTFVGLGQQYLNGCVRPYYNMVDIDIDIDIANSVEEISDYAFCYCSIPRLSSIPSLKLPSNLKAIGDNAFLNCSMSNIEAPCTISEGVLYIIQKNIGYPSNISNITVTHEKGEGEDVVISGKVTDTIDYKLTCDGTLTITGTGEMPDYESTENYPYPSNMLYVPRISNAPWGRYALGIRKVVIGDGITKIGSHSFVSFVGLSVQSMEIYPNPISGVEFDIANSVEEISDYAFYYCRIPSLKLPSNLESIGESCFENCSELKSIDISSNIKSMGLNAFNNCPITSINLYCAINKSVFLGSGITVSNNPNKFYNSVNPELLYDFSYNYVIDEKVSISQTELELKSGASYKLTATVENAEDNAKIFWFSSDESVATVDETGNVKGISGGTAIITAYTEAGATASCKVTVPSPTSVKLNKTEMSLTEGKQYTLKPTFGPTGTVVAYKWSSSNSSVATVDEKGVVKAVGGGTAVIKLKTRNGLTATCTVTVPMPTKVSLNKTTLSLSKTKQYKLSAKLSPSGVVAKCTWKSSDESVATVDETGNVTAIGGGTAEITVTTENGLTATCVVTVPMPESVKLSKNTLKLVEGKKYRLTATLSPSGVIADCTWKSSNESVATVNATGNITAVGGGTAEITVTTENGLTATCVVTVPMPTKVSLNKTTLSLSKTKQYKLSATFKPSDVVAKCTWKSSNESVATVDETGNVTAIGGGTADITVTTENGLTATCKVTVPMPTKVSLNKTTLSLFKTKQYKLSATLNPSGVIADCTWKSSDESVATVDETGNVTAIGGGTADITVTTENGLTATCKVTVPMPTKVSLNKTTLSLFKTKQYKLSATLNPSGVIADCTWKSSDESVATVDETGNVTAIGGGTAEITVTTENGLTATCKVTVPAENEAQPTAVALNKTTMTLEKDKRYKLIPTLNPTDSYTTYTWSSSDESVATVDETGNVTAIGGGTAEITVTTENGLTATCKVTVPAENEAQPTAVALNKTTMTLEKDKRYRLVPTLNPTDSYTKYTWSSSDESIATVSTTGNVLAVGSGTATITVTTQNGLTATCTVVVK